MDRRVTAAVPFRLQEGLRNLNCWLRFVPLFFLSSVLRRSLFLCCQLPDDTNQDGPFHNETKHCIMGRRVQLDVISSGKRKSEILFR